MNVWLDEAFDVLGPLITDWVFYGRGQAKRELLKAYRDLPPKAQAAWDADVAQAFRRYHGSDSVVMYRRVKSGKLSGGDSLTTTKPRHGADVRAYKVRVKDVLAHHAQDEILLSSRAYGHEKEVILKEAAKPREISMTANTRQQIASALRAAAAALVQGKDEGWTESYLYPGTMQAPAGSAPFGGPLLWHGSNRRGLRELRPGVHGAGDEGEYGIYLTPKRRHAGMYGSRIYGARVLIRHPIYVKDTGAGKLEWMEETFGHAILTKADVKTLERQGHDAIVVGKNPRDVEKSYEVIMFNPQDVYVESEGPR